jgi:hypothetical protein
MAGAGDTARSFLAAGVALPPRTINPAALCQASGGHNICRFAPLNRHQRVMHLFYPRGMGGLIAGL